MTLPITNTVQPITVQGARGALVGMYFAPAAAPSGFGDILLAPAFGEEMNRCRAMVAMQARRFAEMGIGTLVLDPYGTGDSSGEFADASWDLWRDDLRRGVGWLRKSGNGCQTVWGVRTGAILAAELAKQDSTITNLLYWQPVVNGKTYFTQFLRIRIAAEIEQADGIKSTDVLRKMAADGELVEVSGYAIGAALAKEIDEVVLAGAEEIADKRVAWCEVLADDEATIPRMNEMFVAKYKDGGVRLEMERAVGPSFWNLHERTVAPALLDVTSKLVSQWATEAVGAKTHSEIERDGDGRLRTAADDDGAGVARVFECQGDELTGILYPGAASQRRGFIIVVAGGPQYRIGAHRQFVSLARRLSALGYPVLRFDLRGMGDSSGSYLGFQQSEPDIRVAIDDLVARQPNVDEVVLFGECESASGILFYGYKDPRVKGMVLVNPWVRTEGGRAEVILKHYYLNQLFSRELWRRIRKGEFSPTQSLLSLVDTVRAYVRGRALRRLSGAQAQQNLAELPLPVATAVGLRRFRGRVLILMSGRDYIAREFDEVVKSSRAWEGLFENPLVLRRDLLDADHTFSRDVWKRQVADWIREWATAW